MEMWIPLISEYGFPVMVTLYLLHRIEKKLDLLNESMQHIAVIFNQSSLHDHGPKQFKQKGIRTMKSGNIQQYSHLSEFHTVDQFNQSIKAFLKKFGDQFTKGERMALEVLTRFSVKEIGICNARICKLVEAAQNNKGGISRSTFERMLRKARQLGIMSIHHTVRTKGGYSHNVYVFHPFDIANDAQLTERKNAENPFHDAIQTSENQKETTYSFKPNKKTKENRPPVLEELDYTYVPSFVPTEFIRTVKPFFDRAREICSLWDRACIAYNSQHFNKPIQHFLPTIIQAFKETVYQYKRRHIQKSFHGYFYRTVVGMLAVENRRIVARQQDGRHWLYG